MDTKNSSRSQVEKEGTLNSNPVKEEKHIQERRLAGKTREAGKGNIRINQKRSRSAEGKRGEKKHIYAP